uniref:Peptidase aspartic putative domain-containing protein n=1 Tax=Anopheles albimanus TaxID=7167 RepID=A0A182FN43_ANOAL
MTDRSEKVLAFLDEGASFTLIEKPLADRLGLEGVKESLTLKWTADVSREETQDSQCMDSWVSTVGDSEKILLQSVRTVGNSYYFPGRNWLFPSRATKVGQNCKLGLIISMLSRREEVKVGGMNEPVAIRCKLGWTIYGPTNTHERREEYLSHHEAKNI